MFKLLARLFKALSRAAEAVDINPWKGSDSYYVGRYCRQLDEIASALSKERKCVVRTRFNKTLKCAELYDLDGNVLIRVVVNGECGSPEKAIVTFYVISGVARRLFRKMFPLPVILQTSAPD